MLLASVPRLATRRHLTGIPGTAPPPDRRPAGCTFEPRCPLAIERCGIDFPTETPVARDHTVRCWRASEMANDAPQAATPIQPRAFATRAGASRERSHGVISAGPLGHQGTPRCLFFTFPGGCLAVVGESGSGKTTLGRCVVGLHHPDAEPCASTVRHWHLLPATVPHRRRHIQIIFQNPDRSLNPRHTVGQAIGRPLRLLGGRTVPPRNDDKHESFSTAYVYKARLWIATRTTCQEERSNGLRLRGLLQPDRLCSSPTRSRRPWTSRYRRRSSICWTSFAETAFRSSSLLTTLRS